MSTLPQRKHHRLSGYDYGQYGYYYVTICTRSKENLLAQIVPGSLTTTPTPIGEKAIECWKNIAILNKNVEVDKFVLMPNHLHGIIILKNTDAVAQAEKGSPLKSQSSRDGVPYRD